MGEAGYALKRFKSEKIEVAVGDGSYVVDRTDDASDMTTARNAATTLNDESGRFNTTATIRTEGGGNRELFSSVSNVVNMLGAHEYEQHGLLSLGNDDRSHFLIYNRIKQQSANGQGPEYCTQILDEHLRIFDLYSRWRTIGLASHQSSSLCFSVRRDSVGKADE